MRLLNAAMAGSTEMALCWSSMPTSGETRAVAWGSSEEVQYIRSQLTHVHSPFEIVDDIVGMFHLDLPLHARELAFVVDLIECIGHRHAEFQICLSI